MSTQDKIAVVILAAGRGSRMKSKLPKVMHKIAGRPMINWLIDTAEQLDPEKIIVVTAPNMDDVKAAVSPYDIAIQTEQKGTGDAVKPALAYLKGFDGKVLVLLGDEPFVDLETLEAMVAHDGLSVMAMRPNNLHGFGRMVLNDDGTLHAVVEEKDCDDAQRDINICNAGNFCFPATHLEKWLNQIENNNAQGEYYLPDITGVAAQEGFKTQVFVAPCDGFWGINTREELSLHEAVAQDFLRADALENGVTMVDPLTVTLSWDSEFGQDVIIEPNVVFGEGVVIADDVTIHAFSYIEGAIIEQGASIGPFARIRPQSIIGEGASIGNFIEVNRSTLAAGAKAKHVSYLGDAHIGENTNIGAGTIIANYDGFFKHTSHIGRDVFVGSNSTIISPVRVGDEAIIAANSTINKDVPKNAMAVARARQENHLGWASEYRKVKLEEKNKEEDN